MKTQVISIAIRLSGALLAAGQTVLLARLLGAADLGVYSGVLAMTAVLAIPVSAGLPSYLTREVSKANASPSRNRVRALIRTTNLLAILFSVIAMLLLAVAYVFGWVGNGTATLMIAACLLVPLLGLDLLRAGAMRGLGSALVSQLPENILRPGGFLLIIGALWVSDVDVNVTHSVWAFAISAAVSAGVGNLFLKRRMRGIDARPGKVSVSEVMRGSFGLILLGGTNTAIANIDILILSLAGYWVAAGQYRIALLGVVALLIVYNALADVSRRDFAAGMASGADSAVIRASDRVVLWGSLSVGLIALVYAVFGKSAVNEIFGADYGSAHLALIIISFGHLLATLVGPAFELSMALDSQRPAVRINGIGLLVTTISAAFLLNWNPLLAVSIGSAIGNIFRRGLLSMHVSRVLGFDPSIIGAIRRQVL